MCQPDADYDALVDALYFLRSLCESLLDADPVFLRTKTSDYEKFLSCLLRLSAADRIAVMKYWTAWPQAKWLRNDVPERPAALLDAPKSFGFPLRGLGLRHFRNLLESRTSEVRPGQVFLSILQGVKRGCAPVNQDFEIIACRKHKKALTQTIPADGIEAFESKFDAIWNDPAILALRKDPESLKRKRINLKCSGLEETDTPTKRLKNPSFHASIESKRSDGGRAANIQGEIEKYWYGHRLDDYRAHNCGDHFNFHFGGDDSHYLLDMYEDHGKVILRRGVPLPSYSQAIRLARLSMRPDPDEPTHQEVLASLNAIKLLVCDDGLPDPEPEEIIDEYRLHLRAQVELCLEPLKCRVITKGESFPYWVAQTYQKAMWQSLQHCPCFALTGQTVDASHLQGLELQTKRLGLDFGKWVSGDYSAATDGLSAAINQLCVKSLLNSAHATEAEKQICSAVLGNHEITYPKRLVDADQDLGKFEMKNGQLMGSILSFPVLCAINLASYWCALEEYTSCTYKKEELPCLINGDDILFKSNDAFYTVWQKWITKAGFTLSVGKNYISPHFITVNSESWLHVRGHFKKLKWLNCGLLLQEAQGPKQIPLRAETAERPLVPKLQWVLDNCVNTERTYNRIKHHWRRSIAIWTRQGYYNLCAPVSLGGCGLVLPHELRDSVCFTKIQQQIAGAAHLSMKKKVGSFSRECPSSGYERIATIDNSPKDEIRSRKGGYLVLRGRTEPVRECERRFQDPACSQRVATSLLNCQSTTTGDQPIFEIKEISQRKINKAHDINEVIHKPFDEYLEFRQSTKGPTDDVPLPRSGVKRTEMATEHSDPQPRLLVTLKGIPLSPTDGLPGFCFQDVLNRRLLDAVAGRAPYSCDGEDSDNGPHHLCY